MRRLGPSLALLALVLAGFGGGAPRLDPAHLPKLPPDVLAVQTAHDAVLLRLDGSAIGRLDDYTVSTWGLGQRALYAHGRKAFRIAGRRLVPLVLAEKRLPARLRTCDVVGRIDAGRLVSCPGSRLRHMRPLLLLRADGSMRALVPAPPHSVLGRWAGATVSPDGERLLLQWTAECETRFAFLAPAAGGRPVSAIGGDWAKDPESVALGWTRDGRALAWIPGHTGCANGAVSGVYAVDGTVHRSLLARGGEAALFHP